MTPLTDDPARHDDGADDASSKVLYSRTIARLNQQIRHSTQDSRDDFSEFIVDTFLLFQPNLEQWQRRPTTPIDEQEQRARWPGRERLWEEEEEGEEQREGEGEEQEQVEE